ncbi:septation protein imp2-like isoform X2 [Penaeus japonicus]|uniref:septation protein imp2-like isoform X1 n=1 Tax=Penaeus japonicus TaxID=27405 RepID=UPI001C70C2AC|nr:septation protein imp2-like isoform X1 [Penaeus japonicus]XP_042872314.1 septation protein imp2-like isoform X1 [Penaeus japonicus]XP_042872315.1 septation protein imp2-like isoform X2 [Penaeus japonicus]XP_042872316.1 septation protein imp2-like isoform X2 [Penaeus japonicus]
MEAFGRSLLRVTHNCTLPDTEHGNLRTSLERIRKSVEVWGQDTVDAASAINDQAVLVSRHANQAKELRKKTDDGVRQKQNQLKDNIKKLHQAKRHAKMKMKERVDSEFHHVVLANKLETKPRDLEKAMQAMRRAVESQQEAEIQFSEAITSTNKALKSFTDTASLSFTAMQNIEETRVKLLRESLWSFANICSLLAVHIDEQQECVRIQVLSVDVAGEVSSWIVKHRTLQSAPEPLVYEATPYSPPSGMTTPLSTPLSSPATSARSTLTRDTNDSDSSNCATPTSLYEAKAVFHFSARSESEISLVEGDVVTVMNDTNSDWILVRTKKGCQGFVPATFVKAIYLE